MSRLSTDRLICVKVEQYSLNPQKQKICLHACIMINDQWSWSQTSPSSWSQCRWWGRLRGGGSSYLPGVDISSSGQVASNLPTRRTKWFSETLDDTFSICFTSGGLWTPNCNTTKPYIFDNPGNQSIAKDVKNRFSICWHKMAASDQLEVNSSPSTSTSRGSWIRIQHITVTCQISWDWPSWRCTWHMTSGPIASTCVIWLINISDNPETSKSRWLR